MPGAHPEKLTEDHPGGQRACAPLWDALLQWKGQDSGRRQPVGVHQLYMSQRRPRGASRECSGLCEEELGQTGGSEVLRLLYPSAAQQRWEEPSCGHARAVCSGRHPPCFCLYQIHSPAAPGLMHGQRRQDGGGAPLPCRLPGVLPVAHPTASSDSAAECRLGLSGRPEPGLQSHPACSPYDQLLPHVAVFFCKLQCLPQFSRTLCSQ